MPHARCLRCRHDGSLRNRRLAVGKPQTHHLAVLPSSEFRFCSANAHSKRVSAAIDLRQRSFHDHFTRSLKLNILAPLIILQFTICSAAVAQFRRLCHAIRARHHDRQRPILRAVHCRPSARRRYGNGHLRHVIHALACKPFRLFVHTFAFNFPFFAWRQSFWHICHSLSFAFSRVLVSNARSEHTWRASAAESHSASLEHQHIGLSSL